MSKPVSLDEKLIVDTIMKVIQGNPALEKAVSPEPCGCNEAMPITKTPPPDKNDDELVDIFKQSDQQYFNVDSPKNKNAYLRYKERTPSLLGIGKVGTGARDKTKTYLRKNGKLSAARDAVLQPVSEEFLKKLGMPILKTLPNSIEEFLQQPYLGKQLDEENLEIVRTKLKQNPDIQIVIGEAFSSAAIENGLMDFWPALEQGLKAYGIDYGTPIYLRHPRLGSGDLIAETVGAKAVAVIIGERTNMITLDSLGIYITYGAKVGVLENTRTAISGIYESGTPYAEAGAHAADLIKRILTEKKSGLLLESGVDMSK